MSQELNIEQKLADLLDTRDFQAETTGKEERTKAKALSQPHVVAIVAPSVPAI